VCVCVVCYPSCDMQRHTVIRGLPALQHFSTLPHKRQDFRKMLLNTKCVLWFTLQLLSEHSSSSRLPMWMTPRTPTQAVHLVTCLVYLPVLWWAKKVTEHYVP